MSDDFPQALSQQVIVPAYVWQDDKQRGAVAAAAARALTTTAAANGLTLVDDVFDTALNVHHLQAQVGRAMLDGEEVTFVAYEQCEAALADLTFVMLSAEVKPS